MEGTNIPSIPSLPLSYEDAIPILKALKGHGLSAADLDPSFDGGLGPYGVEYFTGPSTVDIHLVNEVNTRVMPIWNTMAVIPGYIQDEVVVIGNHRDAWSLGASDPNSGTASQYELARGLGKLLRKGWRPLRSVVLASWDGEEYGLVGSTEWAEDFGAWLQANAAAYLNLDASTSGSNFGAAASPSLARLVRGAAADVAKGANPSRSVWDARNDGGDWTSYWAAKGDPEAVAELEHEQTRQLVAGSSDTGIAPLGSGSDYTAFLMRYGVASTDFSYGGGPRDKAVYMYHSVYDSHTWMKTYGDPGFHKHAEGAQLIGLLALRIADALILPFNTTQYAHDLGTYLGTLRALRDGNADFKELDLDGLASAIRELQSASAKLDDKRTLLLRELHDVLRSRSLAGAWWRIRSTYSRIWAAVTSGTNQRPLLQWDATAEDVAAALAARPKLPPHKRRELKRILGEIRTVNRKLQAFESGLISEDGIHEREWYKHKGTAPGKWLGYGATTVS